MTLISHQGLLTSVSNWLLLVAVTVWLSSRSKPVLNTQFSSSTPQNVTISLELASISGRLSNIWIATRDTISRKCSLTCNYCYGLLFRIDNSNSNLHLLLWILLSGDVALDPGPDREHVFRCLSINAQSIRSTTKLPDGTSINNLKSFQDMVYADNLDLILVTESWLNQNFTNNELLPKGYHVIRNDRTADKRGGGVVIALRDNIKYGRLFASKNNPNWSDGLEIVALELELMNSKKSLVSVCYRPPNCDLHEWLELFKAFLNEISHYEKILIAGDFNFPDLTWNSSFIPVSPERNPSVGSTEFRELTLAFFLHQVNMYPTRWNNILDLILTNTVENISSLLCISAKSLDLSSDHCLTF